MASLALVALRFLTKYLIIIIANNFSLHENKSEFLYIRNLLSSIDQSSNRKIKTKLP